MYIKIFYPVIFLLLLQIISYFTLDRYFLETKESTNILILVSYIALLLVIILFSVKEKKYNYNIISETINKNLKMNILVFGLTLLFILRPTILLIGMNIEFGADQVRYMFYNADGIYKQVYGIGILGTIANYYIVPFLWFYALFISDRKDRFSIFLFYFIVIILSVYNASYAGRFFIYYALIAIYMRYLILGISLKGVLFKIIFFVLLSFFSSIYIVNSRNVSNMLDYTGMLQSIYDYHVGGVFFLAQKLETVQPLVNNELHLFRVIYEGLFSPIFYALGRPLGDLTVVYHVGYILSEATLYNKDSGTFFNAFSTFFYFFFLDYGFFAPIFIFVIIGYVLFSSNFISNYSSRLKYLAYISLVLYFSFFTGVFFMPGYLMVIFFVPLVYFFKRLNSK